MKISLTCACASEPGRSNCIAISSSRPDASAPRLPELRLQRPQRHPAVGALVRAVADQRARERQIAPARNLAVGEVRGGHHRQPRQRAVGHRHVHELPFARARRPRPRQPGELARAVALAQRRHDPERRHQRAAAEIRDLPGCLDRLAPALARQTEQADQAEVVHVVSGGVAFGPVLAVAARSRSRRSPGSPRACARSPRPADRARPGGTTRAPRRTRARAPAAPRGRRSLLRSRRIERLLRFSDRNSADLALSCAPS